MEMKIKELLSKQGKTAVWLSKQIGVTDVNTRNIVNGVIKPKLDTLEKIAKALHVGVVCITGRSTPQYRYYCIDVS